jgi:hypothetical protein
MNWTKHRWVVGCIAVVVTFAVLACGQLVWQKYAVAKPLDKVFHGINGVESAAWEDNSKSGESVKIYVTLRDVTNLQKTYEELLEGGKRILGPKDFKIVIKDARTPELEQFYYNVHYNVQEAIFNGNFTIMAERIREKAVKEGLDARIIVDINNVYLDLSQQSDHMYVVIPRKIDSQGVK